MPEYLAPGVFVEEVSFRSKSIEGVATSTTGFAGMAAWGPVYYPEGPANCEPRLITSFTEFERVYGGLARLNLSSNGPSVERINYLGHSARAFFSNGGKRLYVSRVFVPRGVASDDWGVAHRSVAVGPGGGKTADWRARWPGQLGNVHLKTHVIRSKNIAYVPEGSAVVQVRRAKAGAVVEVIPAGDDVPKPDAVPERENLAVVEVDKEGVQTFRGPAGPVTPNATDRVFLLEMRVEVTIGPDWRQDFNELGASSFQKRDIARILQKDDPEDEDAVVWLDWKAGNDAFEPADLLLALVSNPSPRLEGGHDGKPAMPDDLQGKTSDPDVASKKATGLGALAEIDDIAIVALPDGAGYDEASTCVQAAQRLITHAEQLKYRIAIIDGPKGSSLTEIRDFRGKFDSKHAALYHPWIEILDPTERASQGAPPPRLLLPPSGFMAGVYARTDVTRGVHKAPANEVVRGLTRFEANINQGRQEVLNPEGINALRFFRGRGHRVWGARTISSDPEWKYVNVRRLFIYVEHSIDLGTQWAVFEPNNRQLWDNVRQTVESFLLVLWKDGALMGDTPEQAFFVRCDRTTMTQNDLDNGRLICLIGIAPVKPAEFVIFRIGQWTADAQS